MSKREQLRQRRQARARQGQLSIIAGISLIAVAVVGFLIWQTTRPIGEIVTITPKSLAFAEGKALGPADAPVVIQVFSDFQCPYCEVFAADGVSEQLIDAYVAAGQARLEYRHFIVIDGNVGGTESRRAAEASECAGEQNQFWNYHDLLFANQSGEGLGAFSDRRLKALAETLPLDQAAFSACFDSGRASASVLADEQLARSLGVRATPTVFVNGTAVRNPLDFSEFQRLIEAMLAS